MRGVRLPVERAIISPSVSSERGIEMRGFFYQVEFVSQQVDNEEYTDYGCGVACTTMLLKYHYQTKAIPTYEKLCQELKILVDPKAKGYDDDGLGAYREDIVAYLEQQKVVYNTTEYGAYKTENRLQDLKSRLDDAPIMVGIRKNTKIGEETGHWIVLIGRDEEKFLYYNPWSTKNEGKYLQEIGFDDFRGSWDSTSIQIIGRY
jgi:hypothetical protein